MKLKYIVTCDENGNKSDQELHYWNREAQRWELVRTEECKSWEYDQFCKQE